MKKVVLILLLLPIIAFAGDITTRDGIIYKKTEVTAVENDGIRISHADGVAKIPFEKLPADLQQKYHYDPAKVAAYRKSIADAKQAADRKVADDARARELAERQAAESKHQAELLQAEKAKADREFAEHMAQQKASQEKTKAFLMIAGAIAVGGFLYFAPTIVAGSRGKNNTGAIFILNLFLGWCLIGWVVALVWAFTKDREAA